MVRKIYDVVIIGGGVTGTAVARFLSAYKGNFALLERSEDICTGTSKANSAIAHSGFDATPGSKKAYFNLKGNLMMEALSEELDFPFIKNGSLIVCNDYDQIPDLEELLERGNKNGVEGLEILDQAALREKEPNISDEAVAALYAPTGGIICPFGLNIALAENACENGVEFFLNTKGEKVARDGDLWKIETDGETFYSRAVVNAAGVYADEIHNMVSENKLHITPRKGEYILLDKTAGKHVTSTIFALPTKMGKGVLVTPTVHGNLLIGPTSMDIEDKENISTTDEGLEIVKEKSKETVKDIPYAKVITSFAGLRAHEEGGDFVVGEVSDAPLFFDCAGIESPGLTSAPAIGEELAEEIAKKIKLEKDLSYNPLRRDVLKPKTLTAEEYGHLIEKNPEYGNIICRCQQITEGEILNSIHRTLGATTLDGVKRRTTSQMGRCQGGFCMPKITEILARELNVPLEAIVKNGKSSQIVIGKNKHI